MSDFSKINDINVKDSYARIQLNYKVDKETGKGLFSGDYNDLKNKPSIPSTVGLATTQYVDTKVASAQLSGGQIDKDIFATKEELNSKADKSELNNYASKTELSNKADKTELNNYASKTALNNKADKTELNAYASKIELDNKADKTALGDMSLLKVTEEQYNQLKAGQSVNINGQYCTYNQSTIYCITDADYTIDRADSVLLQSANGSTYKLVVSDNGVLSTQLVSSSITIDIVGVITSATSLTITQGYSASVQVKLDDRPSSDTIVSIDATSGLTVSPSQLTFTRENYNVNQQITIKATGSDSGTVTLIGNGKQTNISVKVTTLDSATYIIKNGSLQSGITLSGTGYRNTGSAINLGGSADAYFVTNNTYSISAGDTVYVELSSCADDGLNYLAGIYGKVPGQEGGRLGEPVTDDKITTGIASLGYYRISYKFTSSGTYQLGALKYFGSIDVKNMYIVKA